MSQPGRIAVSHKRTQLPNGYLVNLVEPALPLGSHAFLNCVHDRAEPWAPIHTTRHSTLEEALWMHKYVCDDYRDAPRVTTERPKGRRGAR